MLSCHVPILNGCVPVAVSVGEAHQVNQIIAVSLVRTAVLEPDHAYRLDKLKA